ncbi:MAG: methyl-accepting chemotaxis protein [Bradyrhizobiaceae bacterium]|nr:MAG: methyl-accepting chemotaxis protein [Bradyrhizobiaceae bacterium]
MTSSPADPKRGFGSRLFTDRKIATKIAIGYAAVLVITIAISALAYQSLVRIGHGFEDYSQRVAVVDLSRELDRAFLDLRRYVREYAISGVAADREAAEKARGVVQELLAKALDTIKDGERSAKTKHLAGQVEIYTRDFQRMSALRREQSSLVRETLDPVGTSLAARLEQLQARAPTPAAAGLAGEAFRHVMAARLNAGRLLDRHEKEAGPRVEKSLADLANVMTSLGAAVASGDARRLYEESNAEVARYAEAYKKAAADAAAIDALVNGEMRKVAQAIAEDAEAIKRSGVAEEHQIEQETARMIAWTETFVLALALAGVALGLALAWLIGRAISRPIRRIGEVLLELANGNKAVEVPYADRGDEVGDNARAAKTFKENLLRIERMEAEQREAERRAAEQRRADMHRLADEFQSAVGNIVETVSSASTELEAAAGTLTRTAETTQQLSATVASASEEASANVQSVATASEEMASSVGEISRQVQMSSEIAAEAVKQAEATNAQITELSNSASRIGDVVKLITAIAEQTNLLALNATIEAARAGDAGRGFAVVAQEVKALASQTAKATEEIGTQIAGMQAATGQSVAAIQGIGGTIARIAEIASTIAAAVEEQGAATREIARNVQEAAKGTTEVASNIGHVSHGAGETGSASTQVLASAQSLSSESNHLRLEVDKFLATVRAA